MVTSRGRFLLRDAVNRAKANHQGSAGNAEDSTAGKELLQYPQRRPVIGVVVCGNKNNAVGDIKIDVTGRKPCAFVNHQAGHRQRHDGKLLSVLISRPLKPFLIFPQRHVVFILGIFLEGAHDGSRIDKPGDVVNVAIRVIPHDPLAQPDEVVNSQPLP